MPAHGLQTRHETRSLLSSLGRLGRPDENTDRLAAADASPVSIRFAQPRDALTFPAGVETRAVDSQGRIKTGWKVDGKLTSLPALLRWTAGGLDVVMVDGWAVITQPASHVGVAPGRGSTMAALTVKPCERVQLRSGHLNAFGAAGSRTVLIAPIPAAGALIVVSPNAVLAAAAPPAHVLTVLTDEDANQNLDTAIATNRRAS